jgi:hypothetical protein
MLLGQMSSAQGPFHSPSAPSQKRKTGVYVAPTYWPLWGRLGYPHKIVWTFGFSTQNSSTNNHASITWELTKNYSSASGYKARSMKTQMNLITCKNPPKCKFFFGNHPELAFDNGPVGKNRMPSFGICPLCTCTNETTIHQTFQPDLDNGKGWLQGKP